MAPFPPLADLPTHLVENQPPLLTPDLWSRDPALIDALTVTETDRAAVQALARQLSDPDILACGSDANRYPPELRLFDAGGRRLDEVAFHPAYHRMMSIGLQAGYSAIAWDGTPGGHVAHAAMVYLMSQAEPGVCCPMTMTYAAVPALAADPGLGPLWVPRLTSRRYDPAVAPVAMKDAATLGMAMTEKQGGSDVRANTTRAEADGDGYRLTGHKWFCSAPMSDGFLTLAQAPGGLTCFLVPRWLDDGRNGIRLMRLKDKLGNRSNASCEIEYIDAVAHRLGAEGAGVRTILQMVHHTRLDTAMAPAGLMRAALVRAVHWCRHRTAFQRKLIDQPLMRAVLADLALDWEGALALGLHVARVFDRPGPAARALARVSVALAKFLSNKRCPNVVYEAMECLGGMGYVEDTGLPLLFREAPLNSIWEGSGNVICLDILRSLARDPLAAPALAAELDAASGGNRIYDTCLAAHRARWPGAVPEAEARWFCDSLAGLLTAAVLLRHAPDAVADGYVTARLTGQRGHIAGAVTGLDTAKLLHRLSPDC